MNREEKNQYGIVIILLSMLLKSRDTNELIARGIELHKSLPTFSRFLVHC